jgi:predicted 2-oxoglutarate/Fe(II)-dependent dioxygenase YbiX
MLILFPSNYAYSHIAHPVTSGTKYAMVTWIRDREIRD